MNSLARLLTGTWPEGFAVFHNNDVAYRNLLYFIENITFHNRLKKQQLSYQWSDGLGLHFRRLN